jgi:hypothetical protein
MIVLSHLLDQVQMRAATAQAIRAVAVVVERLKHAIVERAVAAILANPSTVQRIILGFLQANTAIL